MKVNRAGQDGMEAIFKVSGNTNKTEKRGTSVSGSILGADPIAYRRALAHKQAIKVVKDAFKGQQGTVDRMKGYEDLIGQMKQQNSEYRDTINESYKKIDDLQKQYGISDESEEQKELELIERAAEKPFELSEDERAKVADIKERGLTEYQQKYLSEKEDIKHWEREIDTNNANINSLNQSIKEMKKAMLKDQSMVKATKAADEMEIQAAKNEAVSLIAEAKDNIEDDLEEAIEKAEEIKEKRAEEEEKELEAKEREARIQEMIERIRESSEENKERTEDDKSDDELSVDALLARHEALSAPDLSETKGTKDKINNEIKTIAAKLRLVVDDIKGSEVDKTI